jgi:hypothetical protein
MSDDPATKHDPASGPSEFESLSTKKETGLVAELVHFVASTKKWWLAPVLLVLGLLGLIAVIGATGGAPFIYTLF